MEWDSTTATRGDESDRGRGILATKAEVFRRGVLEEAPRKIQEKEERKFENKGKEELGTRERCIPDEATSSGGDARGVWGLFSGCTILGPKPDECPKSEFSALLEPEDTSAGLRCPPSSLGIKQSPPLRVPQGA